MISIIVAVSANNVIGAGGELPWRLPDDLRRFRRLTMHKPIVMGRRTWESIGRPLPGRQNIVLTRRPDYEAPGCQVVASPAKALSVADGAAEVMIIGGSEIYALFLPKASRIYLTHVVADIDGDTYFPRLDQQDWRLVECEPHPADENNEFAFEFRFYERTGRS